MGCVKNYDWGRPGKESHVARLYSCNSGDHIDQDKPYAEFWMGTHDSGPSYVVEGARCSWREGCEGGVPTFLSLQVLSVAKALSIQAHPDKDLASRLHSELPDVYKDDNHKPEMALALTEFEALCGFISLEELKLIVQTVPEIVEVVGTAHVEQVLDLNEDGGKEKGKLVLQSVFTELMQRATEKEQVVLRLDMQYPADVGVLAALVKLCETQSWLTPKHRDVKTLCSMLTYRQGFPEILQGTAVNPHVMRYIPPFDEFEVDRCILPKESTAEFPVIPGPSIFMVVEGTVSTSSMRLSVKVMSFLHLQTPALLFRQLLVCTCIEQE
ncbi:hypothetical protein HAX54_011222 [Datura stramonium]|uniref:Phosphomannose isomerase type I catalytic domain-containing protein n=1 Tax=Datura stramonium TaxID=4076 RepID=A0ABS8THI3_DATST|nr:hypothetical protein [Datura stramonium]